MLLCGSMLCVVLAMVCFYYSFRGSAYRDQFYAEEKGIHAVLSFCLAVLGFVVVVVAYSAVRS